MATLQPPPYSIDTQSSTSRHSESALDETATALPLQINTVDLSGLRAQILDNAPILFTLAHSVYRPLPPIFRVCTWRIDQPSRSSISSNASNSTTHAAIYVAITTKNSTDWGLFVQGPGQGSREAALGALLRKVESMIASRRERFGVDLRCFVDG